MLIALGVDHHVGFLGSRIFPAEVHQHAENPDDLVECLLLDQRRPGETGPGSSPPALRHLRGGRKRPATARSGSTVNSRYANVAGKPPKYGP